MKKKWMLLATGILSISLLAGCTDKATEKDQKETETIQLETLADYNEYLTIGQYKGIEVERAVVTDEEVENRLVKQFRDTIEIGDTANIDYVGMLDGVAFENGSAQGVNLTIGSNTYIDGFEEGLVGHKIGEEVVLNLTFPDPYKDESLSGKAVVFNVIINGISGVLAPELNQQYLKENTQYSTIEAYKESVRDAILQEKKEEQKNELWSMAVGNASVKKYPENELEYYKQECYNGYQMQVLSSGMTMESWLQQIGSTQEEFDEYCEAYAEQIVKQSMLMREIAKAEAMEITEEEYKTAVAAEAQYVGCSEEELISLYYGDKDSFKEAMLFSKVLDFIVGQAVEVEPQTTEVPSEGETTQGEETTSEVTTQESTTT